MFASETPREVSHDTPLIIEFFREIYRTLAKKNLCALKGAFVIEYPETSQYNIIEMLQDISKGPGKAIRKQFRSHEKFLNLRCQDQIMNIHELKFKKKYDFTCNLTKGSCATIKFATCKFYLFSSKHSNKYIYLKFERYKTKSVAHLRAANKKYIWKLDPIKRGYESCPQGEDLIKSNDIFYHSEDKEEREEQQLHWTAAADISEREYNSRKSEYSTNCSEGSTASSSEISNEIYIPARVIEEYFSQPSLATHPDTLRRIASLQRSLSPFLEASPTPTVRALPTSTLLASNYLVSRRRVAKGTQPKRRPKRKKKSRKKKSRKKR
jgi:hypothetical protein